MGPPLVRHTLLFGALIYGAFRLTLYLLRFGPNGETMSWLLLAAMVALILLRVILDGFLSRTCPYCGRSALKWRSVSPFTYRYCRCRACGVLCKRSPFGNWEDASGPADARRFAEFDARDPWHGGPVASANDAELHGTQGSLLRSKRRRNPSDPNRLHQ